MYQPIFKDEEGDKSEWRKFKWFELQLFARIIGNLRKYRTVFQSISFQKNQ